MRADRLISLIMLLETKGPLTAKELADELQVTERTIYRDIDSLCIAGIPVYGVPGPQGGYRLIEGYRSYLNGLNKDELLALLSINIPQQFNETELGSKLKAAILKIRSSYKYLSNKEEVATRLYIDSCGWGKTGRSSSHINTLYTAICNNKKLSITYNISTYPRSEFNKLIEPYGLVTKENIWYLVYFAVEKIRVINIDNIISTNITNEYFNYPVNFKLEVFWGKWCSEIDKKYSSFRVKVLVPKQLKSKIDIYITNGTVPFTPIPIDYTKEEWLPIDLFFDSFEDARHKLLSFGGAVKVVEPESLRYSIIDYAKQIQNLYKL